MDLNASLLWATPVVTTVNPDHAGIKRPLVELCYEMQRRATAAVESGVTPSKKANLYESRFDFFRRAEIPEVQALRTFCASALSHAIYRLSRQANPEQPPASRVGVDMFESWVHVTKTGGYHEVHYHPNCSWCGIYYLEPGASAVTPPNGVNRFFSPAMIGYEDLGSTAYRHTPLSVPPEEGKLVLFPAYVQHSAAVYRGDVDRVVVSFNARVVEVPARDAAM